MGEPGLSDSDVQRDTSSTEVGDSCADAGGRSGGEGSRFFRIVGLDRSAPTPSEQLPGEPLRPFTPANLISFARLALIPVFLVLALSSGDGRIAIATVVFTVAAASDYLDGLVARATGKFSRLGALLDPTVDRLLALAAVVVAWRFDLLPRWGLAALAVHEVYVLILGVVGMRMRVHVDVNWPGRISFLLVMFGFWLALVSNPEIAPVIFLVGVALTYISVVFYVRDGLAVLKARRDA